VRCKIQQETPRKRCVTQASSTQPVVEDTEQLKLVGSVTERDLYWRMVTGAHRTFVSKELSTLFAWYSESKTVKETRRKFHAHRAMSLPVADKAGGYL